MSIKDVALDIARISRLPVHLLHLEAAFNEPIYFGTVANEVLEIVDLVRMKAVGNINKHIKMFSFIQLSGMVFLFVSFPDVKQSLVFGPFYLDSPSAENLADELRKYYEMDFSDVRFNRILNSILVLDRSFIESWGVLVSKMLNIPFGGVPEYYEETPTDHRKYSVPDLAKTRMVESTVSYGYEFEHNLREAIKAADRTKLYDMLVPKSLQAEKLRENSLFFNLQNRMTSNKFRQLKNLMIVLNTIFRLSAQEAGLPPIYLHSISDSIAMSVEEVKNMEDIQALIKRMVDSYCDAINRARLETHSFRIMRVQKYILSHLADEINLEDLAEIAESTKQHLSRQFRKECGVTITQYIRTQRINEAKAMIESEDSSMLLIAETLGFSSQNYFCDVFQKETGMTPTQYKATCEKKRTSSQNKDFSQCSG